MDIRTWAIALGAALSLSACGDSFSDQALIGAGAGGAAAVVLDGKPFTGAVLGAAGNLLYCQTHPSECG